MSLNDRKCSIEVDLGAVAVSQWNQYLWISNSANGRVDWATRPTSWLSLIRARSPSGPDSAEPPDPDHVGRSPLPCEDRGFSGLVSCLFEKWADFGGEAGHRFVVVGCGEIGDQVSVADVEI
jgi:hypothetical protein